MTTDHIEIFCDAAGEFRWRRVAANGQVVSVPGEGYTRKNSAIRAAVSRNRDVPREQWIDKVRYGLRVQSVLLHELPRREEES